MRLTAQSNRTERCRAKLGQYRELNIRMLGTVLKSGSCGLALCSLLMILLPNRGLASSGAPTISGLLGVRTDASGETLGGEIFSTIDAHPFHNLLYITAPNSGINGPISNPQLPSYNHQLSVGTSEFFCFGQPLGFPPSYFGLNLFFNGENNTPGISVVIPIAESLSPPFPAFSVVNSSVTTLALNASFTPASGTLSFSDGPFKVVMTDIYWLDSSVENIDIVSGRESIPGQGADFIGRFTLEVTAVPEPCSVILLLTAIGIVCPKRNQRDEKTK